MACNYDYRKLRGRIKEKFGTQSEFSKKLGLSEVSVSNKLNNIVDYFLGYKKKYIASRLKLVLVGGIFGKTVEHPDIIYTGFVGDAEKVLTSKTDLNEFGRLLDYTWKLKCGESCYPVEC